MPYTDDQIKNYAFKLESAGAPEADIEEFVKQAKQEQGSAAQPQTQPAPQPAPQPQRVMAPGSNLPSPFSQEGQNNIQNAGGLGGAIVGAAKGLGSTITGASELGSKIFKPINEKVLGVFGQKMPDTESMYSGIKKTLQPNNLSQSIGFGAEQIGEFFVPGALAGKAAKTAEVATKAPQAIGMGQKLLTGAAKAGKVAAKDALEAGSISALQQGGINEDVGVTAGIAGALPLIGAAAKPITKIFKEGIPSKLINSLIKPAQKEFKFAKNPGLAVAKEGITGNTLADLAENIGKKKNEIGKMVGEQVKKGVGEVNAEKLILEAAYKKAQNITDPMAARQLQNALDQVFYNTKFSQGKIIKGTIKDLTKLNAEDLHKVQKKIGQLTKWSGQPYEQEVNQALVDIYSQLGKKIDQLSPGTKTLQRRYASLLGAEKAAENRIGVATRNNALGLQSGVLGVGGFLSGDNLEDRIRNAATGFLLPKVLGSAALKTRAASLLTKEGGQTLSKIIPGAYNLLNRNKSLSEAK